MVMNKSVNSGVFRQQLSSCIKDVFEKSKVLGGSSLDEELMASARDEDEAEVIREMCENVDLYGQKRDEYRSSGMKPGKWLEKEMDRTVEAICPEADEDYSDKVKSAVSEAMISEIRKDTSENPPLGEETLAESEGLHEPNVDTI